MKEFCSIFHAEIEQFLQLQAASGRKTANHCTVLKNLDAFLCKYGHNEKKLDEELVLRWLSSVGGKTTNKESYIARFRGFSKYLRSLGIISCEPEYPRVSHDYVPYVFSDEEWQRMIREADSLPYCSDNPESAVLFSILLRMLYGCGLRLGEAMALELKDIDLIAGVLFIRHAKNDKQRYVPMSWSLVELLRDYINALSPAGRRRVYLFANIESGERYSVGWARKRMAHLLKDADIEYERSRAHERGPCLHCFRHTFVACSFNQLMRLSLDFEDASPFLSAYLGHCDIRETDKYLHANYEFYRCEQEKIAAYTQQLGIFPEVVDE